jgi:type I restriction enzyme S subunit
MLNQRVGRFTVNAPDRVYSRYLFYVLRSSDTRKAIEGLGYGSAQPNVSPTSIHSVKIPLPSLIEQQAIGCILGTLDDKIHLNREANSTLEAVAQAIFKNWFIDFEPVHVKSGGQQPPSLTSSIAALFPDSFEQTRFGEIPKGWIHGRLGDVTGFLPGFAFKSKDWIDSGVPVVKIGSVKPGFVDLNEVSFVSDQVANEASRFRLKPGDLVIGMTGYVGEVGLVPQTGNPPLLNQRVGKFILEKEGTETLGFVYCLTRQPNFKSSVEMKSHGTAQANVSTEGILSIPAVIPAKPLRDAFNRICHPILQRMLNNHSQSQNLVAFRDSLLPMLISAELNIADAERIVGRCV